MDIVSGTIVDLKRIFLYESIELFHFDLKACAYLTEEINHIVKKLINSPSGKLCALKHFLNLRYLRPLAMQAGASTRLKKANNFIWGCNSLHTILRCLI